MHQNYTWKAHTILADFPAIILLYYVSPLLMLLFLTSPIIGCCSDEQAGPGRGGLLWWRWRCWLLNAEIFLQRWDINWVVIRHFLQWLSQLNVQGVTKARPRKRAVRIHSATPAKTLRSKSKFGTLCKAAIKIYSESNSSIHQHFLWSPTVNNIHTQIHYFTMSHPKLEQAVQKVDEFLATYPTLCQYGECVIESWSSHHDAAIKQSHSLTTNSYFILHA